MPKASPRVVDIRLLRCMRIALLLLTAVLTWPAHAAAWAPPPPPADDFDWVQLTSGEWLKGEIKAIYRDSLEFDSDKLDLLTLDMKDVKTIRSGHVVNVRVSGDRVTTGKLLLEDGQIKVGGEAPQVFPRDTLLSVTAGVPKERNYWTGKVSLGGNIRSGNSDQTDVNVMLNAKRQTVEDRIELGYIGNYSVADSVETTNNHHANAVWDRFVSDKLFMRPVFGQYDRDPFQNIAHRYTVGTGVGYQLIDTAKTEWSVFTGPAFQRTRFIDVQPGESLDESTPALSAGTNFKTKLNSKVEFTYGYQFQFTNEAAGQYNHHMIGSFDLDFIKHLDLQVSLIWDRTAKPKTNADGTTPDPNDLQLILGVGYDF